MELKDILEIVHKAYPHERTRECWDGERRRPRCPSRGGLCAVRAGDILAEFIVGEIVDTYDAVATDRAQIADAVLAMNRAQNGLDAVAKALERRLERHRREDAKAS